ncbi:MAG: hypothetical protein PVJ33_02000 [Lysobacterales bacterium]|jgi:hypothetical protein
MNDSHCIRSHLWRTVRFVVLGAVLTGLSFPLAAHPGVFDRTETGDADAGSARCQVRFLGRGQAGEIDEGTRAIVMERPGEYQREVVQAALDTLPPLVCSAVRRVVFVDKPGEQAIAYTNAVSAINDGKPADLVYFNNWAMPEQRLRPAMVKVEGRDEDAQASNRIAAIHAVIHEAAHVADHLLDSQRVNRGWLGEDPVDAALWPVEARQLAAQAADSNLLKKGFRQEWIRLHEAFVQAHMARAYYGKGGGADLKEVPKIGDERGEDGKPRQLKDRYGRPATIQPAPLELAGAGFMTRYGGTQASEDIAEIVAGVMTRQFLADHGVTDPIPELEVAIDDHACKALNSLPGPDIPSEIAGFYAKLGFLQSVGFISLQAYERCVGRLKIPGSGEGFFTFKSGRLERSYSGNPGGRIGQAENNGPFLFELGADGTVRTRDEMIPVRVTLILDVSPPPGTWARLSGGSDYGDLKVDDVSFPRGVYFVGFRHGPFNRLEITRKDDGRKIMDVGQGVALVSRASRDLIEGSVFVQRYFNFAGGMLSSIAGDEPPSEPTRITFRRKP